jgi:hypothetical protein
MRPRTLCRPVSKHPSQLRNPGFVTSIQFFDTYTSPIPALVLLNREVRISQRRYLRQVSNANHLMGPSDAFEPLPYRTSNLSPYIRIYFVEYKNRNFVDIREKRFQRQHHPGQLSTGGHLIQRSKRLTHIG